MGLRGLYKVAATTAASWDLLLKALIQVTVDCDRFCPKLSESLCSPSRASNYPLRKLSFCELRKELSASDTILPNNNGIEPIQDSAIRYKIDARGCLTNGRQRVRVAHARGHVVD